MISNPISGSGATQPPGPDHNPGPESLCEPFQAVIQEKLGQGLTGQRIYQDRVEGHGFTASYSIARRFLQRLDQSQPSPFRRTYRGQPTHKPRRLQILEAKLEDYGQTHLAGLL